jgi:protein gp37
MAGRNLPHLTNGCGFTPTFHPERLDKPLHWRKPQRIFVNSMSDLFHEAFTDEQIDMVFAMMQECQHHTFMILTKRAERMYEYIRGGRNLLTILDANACADGRTRCWPLKNVHVGVTAENQQRADERIPILLDTPAAVRFVSVEPMLGPVKLWNRTSSGAFMNLGPVFNGRGLDWVICGAETGPGARIMQPEWAYSLYLQCKAAGVPFWFKQGSNGVEYDAEMVATRELPGVDKSESAPVTALGGGKL